ncbi:hypothetical protein BV20DRAFT_1049284 [Pilatotrama ljubarskyi]|nr:hypothetical protein BV20DRAFT_1049284 [Pilatotrama ljubarskyi]
MRLHFSLISLALLAGFAAAAPVDSLAVAKRAEIDVSIVADASVSIVDNLPTLQARTCPNGSAGCGDGPLKREVEVREPTLCTGGMHCAEW